MIISSASFEDVAQLILTDAKRIHQVLPVLHWGVTGGRTVGKLYAEIVKASSDYSFANDQFWFTDERCVPPTDVLSNYKTVSASLLTPLNISSYQVHRILGELRAKEAAALYQKQLMDIFNTSVPCMDILILSMGDDGHVASLFPQYEIEDESAWMIDVPAPEHIQPHVPRVSMTWNLLTTARKIYVLIAGEHKINLFQTQENLPIHRLVSLPQCVAILC